MTTPTELPSKTRSWGAFLCVGVVLLASGCLLFYKLGAEPFQDYDEATYAEVTTESLASHNYLTFTYNYQDYFNKPPLLFWLMDISKSVVGDNEVGNRLPSTLSGFVLIVVVIVVTWAVTQNGYAAALAGGILATTGAFIEPARQARFDILVSLFITLSVFAFLRALEDRRWFLWYGAFIGLTVLAKGPLVLFAILPSLAIAVVYRSWSWLRDKYFWGAVGIALLIALPWHIYETVLFGSAFWNTYLFGQVVDRVQQVLFVIQPTNAQYVQYFFEFAAPWAYVFCAAFLATPFIWKRLSKERQALLIASYVGVATVFVVCFVTSTKAFSYLIPAYSFMTIACALVLFELARFKRFEVKMLITVVSACLLICGFYCSVFNGFHINPYFTAEVSLAEQEKTIGLLLKSQDTHVFYTYNVTTVGSIMYYSRLLSPVQINSNTKVPKGAFILYKTADEQNMQKLYPNETVLYRGTSLSISRSAA